LRFACDTPAFFNLPNLSAVKTEGLHSVSTIILIGGTWSGSQPPAVLQITALCNPAVSPSFAVLQQY